MVFAGRSHFWPIVDAPYGRSVAAVVAAVVAAYRGQGSHMTKHPLVVPACVQYRCAVPTTLPLPSNVQQSWMPLQIPLHICWHETDPYKQSGFGGVSNCEDTGSGLKKVGETHAPLCAYHHRCVQS